MEMTFKLEVFEGPLDLLLHLIDINKIDIYDIPIAMITDQYMDYIHRMQIEDMDVTSDFLVMAATLLRIKSKMLLPVEKADAEETGEDPRMELVNRLLEYKTYKYIAQELKDRAFLAAQTLYKPTTIPDDMVYTEPPVDLDALVGDMNLEKLHRIFQSVMKRQFDKIDPIRSKYGRIEQEPVKLSQNDQYPPYRDRQEETGQLQGPFDVAVNKRGSDCDISGDTRIDEGWLCDDRAGASF